MRQRGDTPHHTPRPACPVLCWMHLPAAPGGLEKNICTWNRRPKRRPWVYSAVFHVGAWANRKTWQSHKVATEEFRRVVCFGIILFPPNVRVHVYLIPGTLHRNPREATLVARNMLYTHVYRSSENTCSSVRREKSPFVGTEYFEYKLSMVSVHIISRVHIRYSVKETANTWCNPCPWVSCSRTFVSRSEDLAVARTYPGRMYVDNLLRYHTYHATDSCAAAVPHTVVIICFIVCRAVKLVCIHFNSCLRMTNNNKENFHQEVTTRFSM